MTLEQFDNLGFDDKLYLVVDNGAFVDNYITEDIRINCYSIHKFFVELVYCSVKNKIIEIRSFNSGPDLDKYLDFKNIDI